MWLKINIHLMVLAEQLNDPYTNTDGDDYFGLSLDHTPLSQSDKDSVYSCGRGLGP